MIACQMHALILAMANTYASCTYKLDKLHSTNVQPWKLTMTMVLQKMNLLPVVDGTEACPDCNDPTQANAVRNWHECDLNDARLDLLLHMTDSVKQFICLSKTAHVIWSHLKNSMSLTRWPSDPLPEETYTIYHARRRFDARLDLLLHMTDSVKQFICLLKTAHAIWSHLKNSMSLTRWPSDPLPEETYTIYHARRRFH
ncbi:hypothetical protein KP509_39G018500 [Ceratopteris richardii]|uniref:Uncharacterized protein n=1 Tax=Ceratopteris richardii TaxID=49495 RepID=A0A8T2PZ64_CERRI|nr:hypothetical protein KP509_39G018500 [Ceratopteris richardii]